MDTHITTFLTGSAFGIIYAKTRHIEWSSYVVKIMHALGVIAVIALSTLITRKLVFTLFYAIDFDDVYSPTSQLWAFIITKELLMPSSITTFFEWNLFTFIGRISYSVYLFHPIVIIYANARGNGQTLGNVNSAFSSLFQYGRSNWDIYDRIYFIFLGSWLLGFIMHAITERPFELLAVKIVKWTEGYFDKKEPRKSILIVHR